MPYVLHVRLLYDAAEIRSWQKLRSNSSGRCGGAQSTARPARRRRASSPLVARAAEGAMGSRDVSWDELVVRLAALALGAGSGSSRDEQPLPLNAVARVTRTVRLIERHPDARLTLSRLAQDARLSPY